MAKLIHERDQIRKNQNRFYEIRNLKQKKTINGTRKLS
jgi:hypothetical protein